MSSIGRLLKITTFGESHGLGVGCIIEGIPSNLEIYPEEIQYQLNRRKPNQNSLLSPRNEPDIVEIYSGIQQNITLGTPICLIVKNMDIKPGDYKSFSNIPRPGHADLTYLAKYGVKSSSGGGRASARETVARVAAGSVVEKFLKKSYDCEIISWVNSIGDISIPRNLENKIILNNKNLKIRKSFIDEIGTFHIFSYGTYCEEQKKLLEEKWLLINKLLKKTFLYDVKKDEILDLGFFFLNNDNDNFEEITSTENEEYKNYNINLESVINLLENNTEDYSDIQLEDFVSGIEENKEKLILNYKKILEKKLKISKNLNYETQQFKFVENINIRCPHVETTANIIKLIYNIKLEKDSIGGIASCLIRNIPRSLGEPCFDKFEAELAKGMLSIPATKGFEIGSGFEGTKLKGSQHNDLFVKNKNEEKYFKKDFLSISNIDLNTKTNNAGGTLGGITTGENVYFKVAIKPVSTIGKNQNTSDFNMNIQILEAKGRHDPCVLPRAMPIIESMAAIITGDHCLIQASRKFSVDLIKNEEIEFEEDF